MDPKAIIELLKQYGLPTVIALLLGVLLFLQSKSQDKSDAANAAQIAAMTKAMTDASAICAASLKQQTDLTRDEIDFLAKMVDNACGKRR
jgi:hypothetical protein